MVIFVKLLVIKLENAHHVLREVVKNANVDIKQSNEAALKEFFFATKFVISISIVECTNVKKFAVMIVENALLGY